MDPRPAFDAHRPPDPALIGDCVHCGFCLPSCPTYVLWGEEMDSPRGRIDLMRQGVHGDALSPAMVGHFDACLGCLACVSACPSGVRYDRLITATRAQVERRHPRPLRERALRAAVFALFPHPRRLRVLRGPLRAAQRLRLDVLLRRSGLLARIDPRLAAMAELTPSLGRRPGVPTRLPAAGARRAVVGLLTGCVQREFFPETNAATARVLAAEGCEVIAPATQGCCGALSLHNGRHDEAARYARHIIDVFDAAGVDAVVVNAAGCGSAMKEYADLLADDPAYAARAAAFAAKVRDVSELLAKLGPVAVRHRLELTVAYHDACHLSHAQGVRTQPRALLAGIPGVRLREIAQPELCCGSAGIYNILQPEPARELADRKARDVLATGADLLVTGNPGCLMQLAGAMRRMAAPIRLAHPVDVLDASIRAATPADVVAVSGFPAPAGTGAARSTAAAGAPRRRTPPR